MTSQERQSFMCCDLSKFYYIYMEVAGIKHQDFTIYMEVARIKPWPSTHKAQMLVPEQ